jgi:hypothetical protein
MYMKIQTLLYSLVCFLVLCAILPSTAIAQEVLISPEVNIRLDKKYVLLGQKKDNILLFRDQEDKQNVDVFDENLRLKYTREVKLYGENNRIYGVLSHGESTSIVYGSFDRDSVYIRQHVLNHLGEMADTATLFTIEKRNMKDNFRYAYSEDETKVLLFNKARDGALNMHLLDLNRKKILWSNLVQIMEESQGYKFIDMVVTNEQEVYMLYEHGNNRYTSDEHSLVLFQTSEGSTSSGNYQLIPMPDYLSKDLHLTYDEVNDNLLIIGLYTEANRSAALGYFYVKAGNNALDIDEKLKYMPFSADFIEEVNGSRKGLNNTLDYYEIKEVVFQQDGGFIWVGEMYRQYIRRSSNPYGRTQNPALAITNGYIDHYTEDMILVALDAVGQEQWSKVIYKKQFSQDDDAAYSSFCMMKTPSRLKFLFNDEIKKNNTVSGYYLDPLGNMQRKTVMNTEYENLKLRFDEAIQISNNSVLLASESSGALNLVKITF